MNAPRLRQLRLARGWSLDDLAGALAGLVTKQALSKYETGDSTPSPRVLNQLAAIFGLKPSDLIDDVDIEVKAFRKRVSLPKKEAARIQALAGEALITRVKVQMLVQPERRPDIPDKSQDLQGNVANAEAAVQSLRERWGLGDGPVGNLTDLIESHGIHVIALEAPVKFDGLSLAARRPNGDTLAMGAVTRNDGAGERQRFSIAHELGHLVLVQTSEPKFDEAAAHRFAGAFLAPQKSLFQDVGSSRHQINDDELRMLKRKYGMSLQAILYRLKDLNIISLNYYTQWCISIGQKGWKTDEPDKMECEKSDWLRRNTLRLLSEQAIGIDEAERILGEKLPYTPARGLAAKRNLMRLSIEERRKILARQAEQAAATYELDQDWQEVGVGAQ